MPSSQTFLDDIIKYTTEEQRVIIHIREYIIKIELGHNNYGGHYPNHFRIFAYDKKTNEQLRLILIFETQYVEYPDNYEQNVSLELLSKMLLSLHNNGPNLYGKKILRDYLFKQLDYCEPHGSWRDRIWKDLRELPI